MKLRKQTVGGIAPYRSPRLEMTLRRLSALSGTARGLATASRPMRKMAVIGAGVTGVTTARALKARGFDVTVFDRHRYSAMETSFANGGQLSASNAEVWNSWSTVFKGIKWMLQRDAPLLMNPAPSWHKYSWMAEFIGQIRNYRSNTIDTVKLAIAARKLLIEHANTYAFNFNREDRGILHFYSDQKELEHAARVTEMYAEGARYNIAKDLSARSGGGAGGGRANAGWSARRTHQPRREHPSRDPGPGGLDRRAVTTSEMKEIEPALSGEYIGGFFTPSDFTGDIHRRGTGVGGGAAGEEWRGSLPPSCDVATIFSDVHANIRRYTVGLHGNLRDDVTVTVALLPFLPKPQADEDVPSDAFSSMQMSTSPQDDSFLDNKAPRPHPGPASATADAATRDVRAGAAVEPSDDPERGGVGHGREY